MFGRVCAQLSACSDSCLEFPKGGGGGELRLDAEALAWLPQFILISDEDLGEP